MKYAIKGCVCFAFAATVACLSVFGAAENVRYFSNDGDDAADGLTPKTAWRTLEKLCKDLPSGAEARLRRGDVFYGMADLKPGLSAERPTVLTAYGEGAKPEICAYKVVKPDPSVWTPTGTNNLWRIDLGDYSKFDGNHMSRSGNVGFLKVDGRIFGRKFFAQLKNKPSRQWDFIDDRRSLTVFSTVNPALAAKDIRIAPCMGTLPFRNHIVVSNIIVRGTGAHGANGGGVDIHFFDCEFLEIGGSHLYGHGAGVSRYGNGMECWGGCRDVEVRRCVFADVYDVGFTMQGRQAPFSWENIHVSDCVFVRCSQCYELWLNKCRPEIGMKNCSFVRNRCVDTARGWAYDVRPNKECAAPLLMYTMATDTCDILVKDNVFINSRGFLIYKSGGLADLPETYRVIDNTIVGPTNQPFAYCVGKEKAAAEAVREKAIRAANRFVSRMPPKVALVPAPREQVWRGGTCTFAEKDFRFVRDTALPPEGYRLDIASDGVTVASADDAGAFYAKKTLKQLGTNAVPCGTATDAPAFRWRGFMLDEGRHFFGKETVKTLLDLMADHKLNVLHWHLTEDQGWRLDIPRFPELVKYGAVRPESAVHGCTGRPNDYRGNGQPYGPYFYSADDVREILAYAKERFITVVPEIEVPGHVRALLAAHPEFACRDGLPRVPRTMNGIEDEVLCAGNDEAIRFMEHVYDEVCALFPGPYVHIGGDECPKKRWKECPKCQARIKSLGLKDEDELQAWVTRHFTDYLAKKGRRAIGWDEVLAGNPDVETVVHNWRKPEYGIEAAAKGHDVVVSALKATYFSVPQGVKDDPFTYLSPKWRCSLAKAYSFNPLSGMTEAAKKHVLGAECCMWSECVWNEYDLAFKLWPRACAFAEAVWTAPSEPRDYEGFKCRMETHRKRLIASGVLCAPLE